MKIILNQKTYTVTTEDSQTLRDIENILPADLEMRRNHDVEFVAELPVKPRRGGRKISGIRENGIYYYEGWNVLCLNYRDGDISPYDITYLGTADDPSLAEVLKRENDQISITIEK